MATGREGGVVGRGGGHMVGLGSDFSTFWSPAPGNRMVAGRFGEGVGLFLGIRSGLGLVHRKSALFKDRVT